MDNAESQPNEAGAGSSQDNSAQLTKAITNAQRLVTYSATKGIKVKQEVLNTLIDAKDKSDWSTESEVEFWEAFREMNQRIKPATVSGVRAISLDPNGRSEARRATFGYTFWTLGVLFIVLLLQIYWVIGNSLAAKLTQLLDEEKILTDTINQAKLDFTMLEVRFKLTEEEGKGGQAGSSYGFYNTPDWERETLLTISERQRMERELEALSVQLERNSAILLRWSTIWQWVVISEEDFLGNEEIKGQSESLANQIKNAEKLITDQSVGNEINNRKQRLERLEKDLAGLDSKLADYVGQLPENQGGTITGTLLAKPIFDQIARERDIISAQIVETKDWLDQPDLVETIKTQRQAEVDTMKVEKAALERQINRETTKEKARRVRLGTEFALIVLQSYLLPVLYGLLGASVYVLRTMNRDISIARFSAESNSSFLLRLALGTLGGLIIGWFGFLLPGQSVVASIPPMALAFLVGYNIEIVFSLMDRLIGKYTRPDEDQGDAEDETEEDETEPDSPTTA